MLHYSAKYDDILSKFKNYTKNPASFLRAQENLEDDVKYLLKSIYDLTKQTQRIDKSNNETLTKLLIDNFDVEQIWQQLELHNNVTFDQFNRRVLQIYKNRQLLHELFSQSRDATKHVNESSSDEGNNHVADNDDESDVDNEETVNEGVFQQNHESETEEFSDSDVELSADDNNEQNIHENSVNNYKDSIVDDDFFKLSQMEQFLLSEERAENQPPSKKNYEFVDYFADVPDESDEDSSKGRNVKYFDFFENPNTDSRKRKSSIDKPTLKKKVRFSDQRDFNSDENNEDSENSVEDRNESKSTYEQRKQRINKHIEDLEEEIISEKPWQMKGEITAKKRPQNSLLEEVLEFNLTTRPAPIITEEVTLKLEDIILRRVKDKAWDDVEKKIKPIDTPHEFKKKLILNQEKSKLSLAEIYEKEYVKQKDELKIKNINNQNEEEPIEHKRIRSLMDVMFKKLDALSNYHFTPMPVIPKIDIVSNLPAITMEEAAPVSVSDATLLAPQEIQEKSKGELVSKTERTVTDKNRARRKKKLRQREKQKESDKKEQQLKRLDVRTKSKYDKRQIQKKLDRVSKMKNVSKLEETADSRKTNISSKTFFEKLNETSAISGPNERKRNKNSRLKIKK